MENADTHAQSAASRRSETWLSTPVDLSPTLVQPRRMYDPTFGSASLWPHLRRSDFKRYSSLRTPGAPATAIHQAAYIGRNGFSTLPLSINNLSGNTIYQLTHLPSELVLRKAVENIRRISHTKQSSRFEIVSRLKLLCQEGLPFCIAKFDIKEFYESINRDYLKGLIVQNLLFAPATKLVLNSFLDQCDIQQISGLPRGLAISAEMSELYLKQFDEMQLTKPDIYFYARYVDDIIIVSKPTSQLKTFRRQFLTQLPCALQLNDNKMKFLTLSAQEKPTTNVEQEFDYLGYKFSIHHIERKTHRRKVVLELARSKIKKRKTRVVLSIMQYLKDSNFSDLRDRIKLLTCNYRFFDHKKSRMRLAGIYHAYPCIDASAESLAELDMFLRKILLSNNGKIGQSLSQLLTMRQKRQLLQLSFQRGFEQDIQFGFSPSRLKRLIDCWKYA